MKNSEIEMLSTLLKPTRKRSPRPPSRRRIEVIDVTPPVPGSAAFLPWLHVPGDEPSRPRPQGASAERSPTFERDLQRVLEIFSN